MLKKLFNKVIKDNFQIILILVFVFIIYYKSIFFGFTDLDDVLLIPNNLAFLSNFQNIINSFKMSVFGNLHITDEFYRPIMLISLIFDTKFYSSFPGIYHLTNILIHLVNTLLLYFFLKELKTKKNISLLLCLIFSIHPVLVHAVSWIPGRNDTLLTLFVLSYFISVIRYFNNKNRLLLLPIFLFYFLSMFTKETGLFCLILTIIYSYLFNENKLKDKKLITIIIGNLLITMIWFVLRNKAIKIPADTSFKENITNFIKNLPGIFVYLGKIFIPINLSTLPIFELIPFLLGIVILLIFALIIFLSKERNLQKYIFGFLFFIFFIVPSFFGSNPDIMFPLFEHRVYLPMIGILIVISQIKHIDNLSFKNIKNYFIFVPLIMIFTFLNIKHQNNYKNVFNFWTNAIQTSSENATSHFGMGTYYYDNEDFINGEKEYIKAIEINPKQGGIRNNLGLIYLDQGKLDEAKKIFEEELGLSPGSDTYYNYGLTLYYSREYSEAEDAWLKVLEIDPDDIVTLEKLYRLKMEQRNIFGAEYYKKELIKRNIKI